MEVLILEYYLIEFYMVIGIYIKRLRDFVAVMCLHKILLDIRGFSSNTGFFSQNDRKPKIAKTYST